MTAIASIPSFDLGQFFQPTMGVSNEANLLDKETEFTLNYINDTVSKTTRPIFVINQLLKIRKECATGGWDGYDAVRVENQTLDNALEFMSILDKNLPAPEICPESDGEIALEWFGPNGSTISISIGENDIINYAAIFPDQHKANGTESLKNEDKGIIEAYIRKVLNTSKNSKRGYFFQRRAC